VTERRDNRRKEHGIGRGKKRKLKKGEKMNRIHTSPFKSQNPKLCKRNK